MHRIVVAAVLCAAISFGADAKFAFLEDGYFSGSDFLGMPDPGEAYRLAYLVGLIDGQKASITLDQTEAGKSTHLAVCIAAQKPNTLRLAYEQHLRNNADQMLRPVNRTFFEFVDQHAC